MSEIVVLSRESFDATCQMLRLKVAQGEGYVEAHARLRRFHGHATNAFAVTYRALTEVRS